MALPIKFPIKNLTKKAKLTDLTDKKVKKAKGKKKLDPTLIDANKMGSMFKANTMKLKKSHYSKG